jgi:hypothetical protein
MNGAMYPAIRSGERRGAASILGGLAGIRVKDHIQPLDRSFIVLTFAAHIADPGREMRHSDQFITKPCKVCEMSRLHDARVTFKARTGLRRNILGFAHLFPY